MADGTKIGYWRCADKNGCVVKGLRDEWLRELTADVLGLDEFSDEAFLDQIDHIEVEDGKFLTYFFKDGHTEVREWTYKRVTHKHTEEYKQHMSELAKARWTPERRKAMGEKVRQIRSVKYWNSTGK
jgi:resolvase domain protein